MRRTRGWDGSSSPHHILTFFNQKLKLRVVFNCTVAVVKFSILFVLDVASTLAMETRKFEVNIIVFCSFRFLWMVMVGTYTSDFVPREISESRYWMRALGD